MDKDITELDISKFKLKLSSELALQKIVVDLRAFERNEKAAIPTALERIQRLQAIEKAALTLHKAISGLDNGSFFQFDNELAMLDYRYSARDMKGKLGSHAVFSDRVTIHISEAAKNAANRSEKRDGRSGRKSVLGAYAGFIAGVAFAMKQEIIQVGRNGNFEKICNAIFEAAGVHAKSEGAIKYYLKNMHAEYKSRGHLI